MKKTENSCHPARDRGRLVNQANYNGNENTTGWPCKMINRPDWLDFDGLD